MGGAQRICYTRGMKVEWKSYACEVGVTYACAMAQLRLWLQRIPQGWQTAFRHETQSDFSSLCACGAEPGRAEWQRFVTPSDAASVRLVPVLPDRSVVSRPEGRIEIAPRHKGLFFVTIPVWVRVQAETPRRIDLGDFGYVPTIARREVNTAVLVDDGQTVVIGGVYEFKDSNDVSKIPFLGDIPFLGNLFKRKTRSKEKAELLVFVTPKILRVAQRN